MLEFISATEAAKKWAFQRDGCKSYVRKTASLALRGLADYG